MKWLVLAALVGCSGDDGGGMTPEIDAPPMTSGCDPNADACTGDTICIANACVAAFPRTYSIANIIVHVPIGMMWDADSSGPDLLVSVGMGNPSPFTTVGMSGPALDTYDLIVPGPYDVTLPSANAAYFVGVDDDDPGSSIQQIVLGCVALPIKTSVLRTRIDGCANGGTTISFGITPKP